MGEKVVWNFELNVIKEYLSRFYSSKFACIREYIANAIAAQFKANVKDPIRVEIHPDRIVIEDRGIGISKKTFKEVFMWFGRSENRNLKGVQGRFGLGAKSFMMLTGEKGEMIMKTRSRKTDEAYSAVLTSYGAEIIDDGGKDDYGTRFEIYPEKQLTTDEIAGFFEKTVQHFEFSRIPIELIATANEEMRTAIGSGKRLEEIIGVYCIPHKVIRSDESYELIVPEKRKYRGYYSYTDSHSAIVYIGDVYYTTLTDTNFPTQVVVRIKVEDGSEVELVKDLLGTKTPKPLPNREGYLNVEQFVTAVGLVNNAQLVKNLLTNMNNIDNMRELLTLGIKKLDTLLKAMASLVKYYRNYYGMKNVVNYLDSKVRNFKKVYELLVILLSQVPVYGYGRLWYQRYYHPSYHSHRRKKDEREYVSVAELLLNAEEDKVSKYKHITKKLNRKEEEALVDKLITAVFIGDIRIPSGVELDESLTICSVFDGIVEFNKLELEKRIKQIFNEFGIREITREDLKSERNIKLYSGERTFSYITIEEVLTNFKLNELMVIVDKITQYQDILFSPDVSPLVRVIACDRKKVRKVIKERLGDYALTGEEFINLLRKVTLVTDGVDVYSLDEISNEENYELVYVRTLEELEILPAISRCIGTKVYAVLVMEEAWGVKSITRLLRDICRAYRNTDDPNLKTAMELIALILHHDLEGLQVYYGDSVEVGIRYSLNSLAYLIQHYTGTKGDIQEIRRKIAKKLERLISEAEVTIPEYFVGYGERDYNLKGYKWINPLVLKVVHAINELVLVAETAELRRTMLVSELYHQEGAVPAVLTYNSKTEEMEEIIPKLTEKGKVIVAELLPELQADVLFELI